MKRVRMMPNPVKRDNGTYYLFATVPADVAKVAKGTRITIPIGNSTTATQVGTHAKASLRTRDPAEARKRFPAALAAVEAHWEGLRQGPAELNHKQCLAIAGEVRQLMVEVFDDNPGTSELWETVLKQDHLVQRGLNNELEVETDDLEKRSTTMEGRFGGLVDAALRRHSLNVTTASRAKVIELTARALSEAAEVNKAKANFDYSDTGETTKYPAYEEPQARQPREFTTLTDILDRQIEDRGQGKDAKAFSDSAIRKMRLVIAEFDEYRDDTDVKSISSETVDGWRREMQAKAHLSNNTIKQRLQNLSTLIKYGMRQSYGALFPKGNPASADLVNRPEAVTTPSVELTYKLDEAREVLRATRTKATYEETRWLPWLCAYSGARVGEVEKLTVDDVFQVDGYWFMRLTTMGKKSLKNKYSERRVPMALLHKCGEGFTV